jgi:hypothetical protein
VIELPRRSVTRFFIPLVDVMMLLFCIFLLMPTVKPGEGYKEDPSRHNGDEITRLRREVDRLRGEGKDRLHDIQQDLEHLRKDKARALRERLAVRVLEIDGATGKLTYNDPDRVEIRNRDDAETLFQKDRRELGVSQKELFYVILYPRDRNSGFPTRDQVQRYQDWFKDVAVSYDIPGAKLEGGRQP